MLFRSSESYSANHFYWDSGNGVTLSKNDNEQGKLVDEDNHIIQIALQNGLIEEVVNDQKLDVKSSQDVKKKLEKKEKKKEEKIMNEGISTKNFLKDEPSKETIKEVVSEENAKSMDDLKEKLKEEDNESGDSKIGRASCRERV